MRERRVTAILIGVVMLSALLATDADAQRGGGGGRGGVASSGSFSSGSVAAGASSGGKPAQLPAKPAQLPSDGRGDWDAGNNAPAFVAGAVVGAAAANRRSYSASGAYYYEPMTTLPCTPKEITAGSVKYYQCGNDYFMQAYDGGSVLYVQVDPPAQQ